MIFSHNPYWPKDPSLYFGGGGGGNQGGGIESPNSLISDSLLKITDLLCEGQNSGFAIGSGIYGNDPLTATYFNNIVVRNLDGSYNYNISGQGFQFAYTLGTTGQMAMSGFEHVTVQLPLPPDTRLSLPPTNAGLPKQIVVTFNTNQYPDANGILVNFRIPSMYTTDANNGNTNGFEVDAQVDCSLNNGPYVALSDPIAFVGKNTTPYFRTYQFTLPRTATPSSFYQWSLKIYKTNTDVQSAATVNDLFLDSVSIISASQYNYPNSALVGLYIDGLQFGSVPSRAYLYQGKLISVPSGYVPTNYNPNTSTITPAQYPTVWNGTFTTGVWTDNPAWIFYDLVTNSRYGLGQYINTNNIDIWTLYQLSQYCDEMVDNGLGNGGLEPQFTINKFIDSPDDAYNMLLNVASSFRGMLYYANGTIRANTTDNKLPVFDYTNANVINGQFNYSSTSRSARHNAVQVKYSDPLNLYRDNYVLIEDNQSIIQYGYNKKEIDAFGCTSLGQATRVANWILTTERLRTETVAFEVGEDGLYVRPGDVFNLYDNFRMNRNQGGRIMDFDSTQTFIELDRTVNLDSGCIYALSCMVPTFNYDDNEIITGSDQIPFIRNPQIQTREVLNANLSGLQTLQVSGAFSGLMKNAVWILSATGVYTANYVPTVYEQAPQYECLAITESSPGILGIIALNYNTGINYTVNTGFTAIMNPVNNGNNIAPPAPTNFTGQLITGNLNNNGFYTYYNLTWTASNSSNVGYYALSGDAGTPGSYEQVGVTTSTGFNYISPVTGLVDFKLCAVGKGGAYSPPQSTSFSFPIVNGLESTNTGSIRFWQLPAGFGDLEQIGLFYNRPAPAITSTNVFFATGLGASFRQVLDSNFYAAEGVLLSGLSTSGNSAFFSSTSYDMSRMVSQNAGAQASNTLLFLVENELMSVGTLSGLGTVNQFGFDMSRGVMDTFTTTHAAGLSGWLFYQSELASFSDPSLVKVFNATGGYDTGNATRYFQIQNNTSVLDGNVIPPSPYLSYTLPDPNPQPPTNLSVITGSGKIIRLTWTPPLEDNIIYYNIYKATGSAFSSTGLIADTVNSFYDDINVNLGTTYEYLVTSVAQNEQQSTYSNAVYAVPQFILPSGITVGTPADPSAITLVASGTYLAGDGTLLSSLTFSVPACNSGDAYQNVIYSRGDTIITGAEIGSQLSNSASVNTTIYDLTPNAQYAFGSQAISNFGSFSNNIVAANGSPFIAPLLPPSPGGAGGPPNIPSGFQASGGLGGVANFIQLSWLPNAEINLEEYGIYKSIVNSQPSLPFAYAGTNSFMDAQVTGGITYYYWLDAINRSEQASSSIGPVTASTENPPSPPTAPTLASNNFYLASDGTQLSSMTFNVSALPSNAAGQYLLYRLHGNTNYQIGNDLNNITSTTATLNDLTAGSGYDVGIQAYSINGISTSVVAAAGSPYTAQSKNTPPNPISLFSHRAPVLSDGITPAYQSFAGISQEVLTPVTVCAWTISPDKDIAYQTYVIVEGAPRAVVASGTLPPNQSGFYFYQSQELNAGLTLGFSGAAVDRNGNQSVWVGVDEGTANQGQGYAGNIGSQSFSAAEITSLQNVQNNAAGGSASPVPILTQWTNEQVYVTSGSAAITQVFQIDLTNRGFNTKPDVCNIGLVGNGVGLYCQYQWDSPDSTDVNASMVLGTLDGATTIAASFPFRLTTHFIEYT